jgi:hypothetical protein
MVAINHWCGRAVFNISINIFLGLIMSGKTITLHHALVGLDCKQRKTERDTQARHSKKLGAGVGSDCKNNPPRRGFWAWWRS